MSARRKSALALLALLLLGLGTWIALDTERWSPGAGGADEAGAADGGRARRRARSGRAGLAGEGERESEGATVGAAGSESGTSPESHTGPDPATDLRPVAKRVRGRVVDAATGEPVAGVRVMLSIFDGRVGVPTGSWGSTSGADGSFEVGPDERTVRRADRIEVRALAPGYDMEATVAEEGVVVRLPRRDGPVPRGTLAGVATTAAAAPLTGRIQVEMTDGLGDWHGIWTLAASDGSFRIDGLRAGPYRVHMAPATAETVREATVAAGAEVRVDLRGRAEADDPANPPRALRLTGLPKDEGLWVRLHIATAGRQYWKAPVVDGATEFPAVQLGSWNVVLERDDVEEPWASIEVKPGDGPLVVELTAPRK